MNNVHFLNYILYLPVPSFVFRIVHLLVFCNIVAFFALNTPIGETFRLRSRIPAKNRLVTNQVPAKSMAGKNGSQQQPDDIQSMILTYLDPSFMAHEAINTRSGLCIPHLNGAIRAARCEHAPTRGKLYAIHCSRNFLAM